MEEDLGAVSTTTVAQKSIEMDIYISPGGLPRVRNTVPPAARLLEAMHNLPSLPPFLFSVGRVVVFAREGAGRRILLITRLVTRVYISTLVVDRIYK